MKPHVKSGNHSLSRTNLFVKMLAVLAVTRVVSSLAFYARLCIDSEPFAGRP